MIPATPNLAVCDPRNAGVIRYLSAMNRKGHPPCGSPKDFDDPAMNLGSHPEIVERVWSKLGVELPIECRCVVYGSPALVALKSGLVLAIAVGTQYAMRVQLTAIRDALALGARQTTKWSGGGEMDACRELGSDWFFGHWLAEELAWCRKVYDAAEDLRDA